MMSEVDLYCHYQKLFKKHYAVLCSYAYKYLQDKDESEDAVQDCFIRFWEIKKEMSVKKCALPYLFISVRNRCITVLRKRMIVVPAEEAMELRDDTEEDCLENIDIQELVQEALALLPPKCGIIFKMSRIEKNSYKEIADELNVSVKTVENQMGKAISILKEFAAKRNIPC